MRIRKEDIPVIMEAPGMIMRKIEGFGDMDATFHEFPKGTDFTPLLKGMPNDSCHCPHWGYILEGAFRFIYDDGTEEVFEEGDLFFAPAGHTAVVDRDVKFVDFSPTKENNELLAHVGKVMAEMG